MEKGDKYVIIRPLFVWKKIQKFSDIFKFIPKSPVAEDLGKEKSRFNELINSPCELTFKEVYKLSKFCKLTLDEMASLIEQECPKDKKGEHKQKDIRYEIIGPMSKELQIRFFEEILNHIPKSVIADDIEKKVKRFDHLLNHVEEFTVRDLFVIGKLCELPLAKMFKLVDAQYAKQNNKGLT